MSYARLLSVSAGTGIFISTIAGQYYPKPILTPHTMFYGMFTGICGGLLLSGGPPRIPPNRIVAAASSGALAAFVYYKRKE